MYKGKTQDLAKNIRLSSLRMVNSARSSHIGSALSIADILAVLYGRILRYKPNNQNYQKRDRFILSKGHACVALYSTLGHIGYFKESILESFCQDNSIFMGHASHEVPGVEFSTGSLGHGLPFGVGKVIASKIKQEKWRTFVLLSDGELQEGSNWEAILFASHHNLTSLVAIVDYNNLQSLTTVDQSIGIEPLSEKLEAFGWQVKIVDGHDHNALHKVLSMPQENTRKPLMVLAKTVKGKGVSFMEDRVEWHYRSPSMKELKKALLEVENA